MGFFTKIKEVFGVKTDSSGLNFNQKVTGKITHFNYRKGYGFIEAPEFGDKIFLHVSELSGKARTGKQIEFKPEKTDKGVKATQAVVLN
jgi:cold shock CspA family protein